MSFVIPGGHYLTPLATDDPVVRTDVLGATSLWWRPLVGESNCAAIHDGTSFVMMNIPQLELPLSATKNPHNAISNVYLFYSSSGPVLLTGPSWATNDYGTSTLSLDAVCVPDVDTGLLVNPTAITMCRGDVAYNVPVGRARWLGSIHGYADGKLRCDVSAGQKRRWDISNLNNAQPLKLIITEPGEGPDLHWYTSDIRTRYLNDDSLCYVDTFTCVKRRVEVEYFQVYWCGGDGAHIESGVNYDTGVQINNEVSPPPSTSQHWRDEISAAGRNDSHSVTVRATVEGAFGINKAAPVETVESKNPLYPLAKAEVFGSVASCRCTVEYQG